MTPTATRLALLENGYSPIPSRDKRTFCKGWPTLEITPDAIRSWETGAHRRDIATGIRVDGPLIVIDVDIDDENMVGAFFNALLVEMPQLEHAPTRYGSGAKEAWFFRLADGEAPFDSHRTATYIKPGGDELRPKLHAVEIFGSDDTRQIGAFGPHTVDDDTRETKITYEWYAENGNPTTVPLSALPVITRADIDRIEGILAIVMETGRWKRFSIARTGGGSGEVRYDLTDAMSFDCYDGATRTLDEMLNYAHTGGARCSASWLEGSAAKNLSRVSVLLTHDGKLRLHDHMTYNEHMRLVDDPAYIAQERAASMAEKLAAATETPIEELGKAWMGGEPPAPSGTFDEAVEELLEGWAYDASRHRCCLPIYGPEKKSRTLANHRVHYSHLSEERTIDGKTKKVNPVDVWITHPRCIRDVDDYRFAPERPRGLFEADGQTFINSFVPIEHTAAPTAKATADWVEFLEHLFPHEGEREWFMDWVAHKVQHLHIPGVAVLLKTPTKGTGRGTLASILSSVLGGSRYVRTLTMEQLVGEHSQSQYTEWLAGRLLISIEEVLQDTTDFAGRKRRRATERLKTFLDPRVREVEIIRKGLPNYSDLIRASFLMATNHEDALALEEDDRRVVVLRCTRTPLPRAEQRPDTPELLGDRIHAYAPRGDYEGEMAASVWHWAMQRDVSRFDAMYAPDWGGKASMLAANKDDLDHLIDDVLENWPHDWADRPTFGEVVERRAAAEGLDKEYRAIRRRATDALQHAWNAGPAGKKVHIGQRGNARVVCFKTLEEAIRFDALTLEERGAELELQRKGNVTRADTLASRLRVIEGSKE